MRVLIVGAGAVGQVYARHLQLAGHHVAFLVKEKYAAATRAGLPMYPLNGFQKDEAVRLVPDQVLTDNAGVARETWDQVWLCISTPALQGQWLDELVAAIGDAVLVSMTPGLRDADRVSELLPAARRVQGMIGFIAWQSPLSTEQRDVPGIAEYLPPWSPSLFGGAEAPARAAAAALTAGHCPARYNPGVARTSALGSAVLLALIAALEAEDWSFDRLGRSETLALGAACARESLTVAASWHDQGPPALRLVMRPGVLRMLLKIAPRVMPFDLETYIAYHFTKVGDQTRHHLETLAEVGAERSLAVGAITQLRGALGPVA